MKITLVELPPTINGKVFEPPILDIYSFERLPSRANSLLHAILNRAGYKDVQHITAMLNKNRILTKEQFKRLINSDIVGISSISRTIHQSYELAQLIKEYNPHVKIIFGGTHVSALPEEALEYGDFVVRKEGDISFPELMNRISDDRHRPHVKDVKGISYIEKGEIIHNPDVEFITNEELSNLPLPVYSEEELANTNVNTIITSRGCPFKCEFCSVIENFGSHFRYLDDESVIELIKHSTTMLPNNKFFIGDDSFAANPKRTKRLLTRIKEEGIIMPPWSAQVRVESAFDKELMDMMYASGCTYVYVGFESVNNKTLELYNKKSTLEKNEEAIKKFHESGFGIHGMFVIGADTDTINTIHETRDFAIKSKIDTVQFFTVTPFPGTKLTQKYQDQGKIMTKAWHLYDAMQMVIKHKNITTSVFQKAVDDINFDFYSFKQAFKFLFTGAKKKHDFVFRIAGHFLAKKIRKQHVDYYTLIKEIEKWENDIQIIFANWKEEVSALFVDNNLTDKEKKIKLDHYKKSLEDLFSRSEPFEHSTYAELKDFCGYVKKEIYDNGILHLKKEVNENPVLLANKNK